MQDIVTQYREQGFVGPISAFDAADIADIAPAFLAERGRHGGALQAIRNRHLDWEPAKRLSASSVVAQAVVDILGKDLLLWRTNFFVGTSGKGLGWHQDEYTTLLADSLGQLSVHLAVTEATADNCVMLMPGTHKMSREALTAAGLNFLGSTLYGTSTFWRSPDSKIEIVRMALQPGEFFIFHPYIVHGSYDLIADPKQNPEKKPAPPVDTNAHQRIGIALRIASGRNQILPTAFEETKARGDFPVSYPYAA